MYSSLENKACIVNLQVVYFLFSSQTFFLPFVATKITNYKDVAIYMFCEEAYLCIAEPKHLILGKTLKTSFKTFTVEGLGKYLFIKQCN